MITELIIYCVFVLILHALFYGTIERRAEVPWGFVIVDELGIWTCIALSGPIALWLYSVSKVFWFCAVLFFFLVLILDFLFMICVNRRLFGYESPWYIQQENRAARILEAFPG